VAAAEVVTVVVEEGTAVVEGVPEAPLIWHLQFSLQTHAGAKR
jgi:hypothetical protein